MKKFLISSLIYFSVFSIWSFYRLDGFQISKVKRLSKVSHDFTADSNVEEIKFVLDKDFFYLGKGHQCFVFESEDGDYVIKLLNYRRFDLPPIIRPFAFIPYIKKMNQVRSLRLQPSLESYCLALRLLKEETGFMYIQMQNNSFHKVIKIKDKANNIHKIDLFDVDFVVQKKAKPIFEHLEMLYLKNKDKFKEAVDSFLEVVCSRINKGISDDDSDIGINYGFYNGKAILIDPGRVFVDDNLFNQVNREKEILRSTRNLRKWILNKYPDMLPFFDKQRSLKMRTF